MTNAPQLVSIRRLAGMEKANMRRMTDVSNTLLFVKLLLMLQTTSDSFSSKAQCGTVKAHYLRSINISNCCLQPLAIAFTFYILTMTNEELNCIEFTAITGPFCITSHPRWASRWIQSGFGHFTVTAQLVRERRELRKPGLTLKLFAV